MTAHDHDAKSDDARLRKALADMNSDTSATHDNAVLAKAREVADEIASGARRPRAFNWARPIGLAAAVVIAIVGLSWILPGIDRGQDDALRGSGDGPVAPQPGVVVAAAPAELRWSAQPGATHYRVTLRNASAAVVWESGATTEPHVQLDATAELPRGSAYFWTVRVYGAAASSELGPFMFQIAAP
jgi:hypothetical protein